LHDLGKISPGFQKKILGCHLQAICRSLSDYGIDGCTSAHAVISEASLKSWLRKQNVPRALDEWATILGLHHGERKERPRLDTDVHYGGLSWQSERHKQLERLLQTFGPLPNVPSTHETIILAAGFVCVCDWIGSDEKLFPPERLQPECDLTQLANEALDAAGWVWPSIRRGLSFDDLFGRGSHFRPTPMQQTVFDAACEPGVFVVESLMGSGKTEAALAGAYRLLETGKNNGIYFALPTRLTSDRIYKRLGAFAEAAYGKDAAVQLLHGLAWIRRRESDDDESQPRSVASWFNPAKRGLLWPLGVGTIDQSLLSILNVKHNFMRAFGLAGKVVILDEVHSYDMYTGTLLDELVKLLQKLGCSVFILSATLTQTRRQAFFEPTTLPPTNAYPLLTIKTSAADSGQFTPIPPDDEPAVSRVYHLTHTSDDPPAIAEAVAERVAQGQAVLWISNTVAGAQRCYRAAKSATRQGDGDIGLLHSAFPPWRRDILENEWMERLGKTAARSVGSLLVSTQVVEQSVDIDADLLVTDIAPTDMLFQRMGRIWRHQRNDRRATRPEVWIIEPPTDDFEDAESFRDALGPSAFVYSPYVLWRSLQVWRGRRTVIVPDQLRELLEATYQEPTPHSDDLREPAWVGELHDECLAHRRKLSGIARAMTDNRNPTLSDREAHTRYSTTPTLSFVLVREIETAGGKTRIVLSNGEEVTLNPQWCDFPTARSIHLNLISLRKSRRVPELASTPRWLRPAIHGNVGILRIDDNDGRLYQEHGEPTELAYNDTMGVYNSGQPEERKETYDNELDW
jgi:CRISPR-associated endonuclease/helicase Cas3